MKRFYFQFLTKLYHRNCCAISVVEAVDFSAACMALIALHGDDFLGGRPRVNTLAEARAWVTGPGTRTVHGGVEVPEFLKGGRAIRQYFQEQDVRGFPNA